MIVTMDLTPELARTLQEGAAGQVPDTSTIQRTFQEICAKMQPAPGTLLPQKPVARTAGLHAGQTWTSADFDAPLPDSFWTSEG